VLGWVGKVEGKKGGGVLVRYDYKKGDGFHVVVDPSLGSRNVFFRRCLN